jgi:hypothetical protein
LSFLNVKTKSGSQIDRRNKRIIEKHRYNRDVQNVIFNKEFLSENKDAKLPELKSKIKDKHLVDSRNQMYEIKMY